MKRRSEGRPYSVERTRAEAMLGLAVLKAEDELVQFGLYFCTQRLILPH